MKRLISTTSARSMAHALAVAVGLEEFERDLHWASNLTHHICPVGAAKVRRPFQFAYHPPS